MSRPVDQIEKGLTDLEYIILIIMRTNRRDAFTVAGLIGSNDKPRSVLVSDEEEIKHYRAALFHLMELKLVGKKSIGTEDNFFYIGK